MAAFGGTGGGGGGRGMFEVAEWGTVRRVEPAFAEEAAAEVATAAAKVPTMKGGELDGA